MNIGILGSGAVGRVLARAFTAEGHTVMLGTRTTSRPDLALLVQENPGTRLGSFGEAAAFGELLVLAVAGAAAEPVIAMAGTANFRNKILIDTTNPIAAAPPQNGVLSFFTSPNESLMERIQLLVPEARVVKAFNSVGNAVMYRPSFKEGRPTMFICGNDDNAKKTVTALLDAFGFDAEDMGKVQSARAIEPLCILWCIPGFIRNQWNHAFRLLQQ